MTAPLGALLDAIITRALEEDLAGGDITTDAVVGRDRRALARAIAKAPLVLCGADDGMDDGDDADDDDCDCDDDDGGDDDDDGGDDDDDGGDDDDDGGDDDDDDGGGDDDGGDCDD